MTKLQSNLVIAAVVLITGFALIWFHCHKAAGQSGEYLPPVPDYADASLWFTQMGDSTGTGADVFYVVSTWETEWRTADGRLCRYADAYIPEHQAHMAVELRKAAAYMADGNNFHAPYYRHVAIETWATQNEDTIARRLALPMSDVCRAFDEFNRKRDQRRPLILAGFSQGGKAVVELLKHLDDETYRHLAAAYVLGYKVTPADTAATRHIRPARRADDTGVTICYNTVKDTAFVSPVISVPCVMGINPVNWRTDAVGAVLHDSIRVTLDTTWHVLVVDGYDGAEYPPILDFINVGDIHSCEPWLYSECLRLNFAVRTQAWHLHETTNNDLLHNHLE
ncbi:MAG: DUF3089 domain-containing protein [Paludibacteraceae bacterium]|nr:DUF3089 domain-containing protein [Paludibacteraceae bacterium]